MQIPAGLYLDTAKLGRMSASAQAAVRDFARLAGEDPLTLYSENWLRDGMQLLPESQRERYPGLSPWAGIADLKATMLAVVEAPPRAHCLLANRSVALVRLAARCLRLRCKKVLVTDLCWPRYRNLMLSMLRGGHVSTVVSSLRQLAVDGASSSQLADRIAADFAWHDCDGLCLPAISHDGIRLPVDSIAVEVKKLFSPAFVVVDASQALGQLPDGIGVAQCDFVIAGAHKWVEAGMPLGIGLLSASARHLADSIICDDALLTYSSFFDDRGFRRPVETTNVWPLIAARASLTQLDSSAARHERHLCRQRNMDTIRCCISGAGWRPQQFHETTQGAIVLVEPVKDLGRSMTKAVGRCRSYGIALSQISANQLRLSAPPIALSAAEARLLHAAFHSAD